MRICAIIAGAALLLGAAACGGQGEQATPTTSQTPNLVVITTDDQTLESLRVMTRTSKLFSEQGTTFTNAVVSFPVCCPSRATWLTGRYAHNHGVRDNVAPLGGVQAFDDSDTVATQLANAGYRTAFVGKYLNGYGRHGLAAPPGWTSWHALVDPTTYSSYDYDVTNGDLITHYGTASQDYQSDVLSDLAVREIEATPADTPLFLSLNFHAPHGESAERSLGTLADEPPVPAPRHRGRFANERLPAAATVRGDGPYPPVVANRPPPTDADMAAALSRYRAELESLLAVDDGVLKVTLALGREHRLDNTVLVFTSDNGTFHGEHGLANGKYYPYEPALRVPLLVRGPGFTPGSVVDAQTSNVDLAPTLLDAAGIESELDGVPLQEIASRPDSFSTRATLIEGKPMTERSGELPGYVGVRTAGWTYVKWADGFEEAYDITTDPQQTTNLVGSALPELSELRSLTDQLAGCAGGSCRATFTPK